MKKAKTDRQIVSKTEYVANLGKKGLASSVGAGLLLISLVCMLLVGLFVWVVVNTTPHGRLDAGLDLSIILFFVILISGAVYIFWLGKRELMTTMQMDVGVPLTRANAADLPAPDVLVRASEKPVEEQQFILLRPSAERNDAPADQMLRPVDETTAGANTLRTPKIEERCEHEEI